MADRVEVAEVRDGWRRHPTWPAFEANAEGVIESVRRRGHPLGRVCSSGYMSLCISDHGRKVHYLCHRFVYECFNGLITDGRLVMHLDNVKTHNALVNLRLGTYSENTQAAFDDGLHPTRAVEVGGVVYISMARASRELHMPVSRVVKGLATGHLHIDEREVPIRLAALREIAVYE